MRIPPATEARPSPLVAGLCLLAALAGPVTIRNRTSGQVTVAIDGTYCCTAGSGSICACDVADGMHTFTATRNDTGDTTKQQFQVTAEGFEWTLSDN